MGIVSHCEYLIDEAINHAYEEECVDELPYDYKVEVPLSVLDKIKECLNSQEVKEPLNDVIFFVGKASKDSIVYHVLCRDITLDAMRKDPNIHFCLLKSFSGVMEQDGGNRTLDEQEDITRERLVHGG